ncbi:MAG: hypothetical protein AAF611_00635 [Bacteroidota bacterium]
MNYKITFSCFFLISSFLSYAQSLDANANNTLVKVPEALAIQQYKENIYIHTDKDIYEPGEDLWFKAYLLNGNDLESSKKTKLIFVKLTQEGSLTDEDAVLKKDVVILREKFEAADGMANGHLFLSETLDPGFYQLSIHTKNTLESHSKELLAVKRFEVKESIIPKILMDVEFSKRTYNRNEEVVAEVSVFSRGRAPYTDTPVIAYLYSGTKRMNRLRVRTDDEGVAIIRFPAEKSKKATSIVLRVKYKKEEVTHSIEIPYTSMGEIQFGMYPEGGSLVQQLHNIVAFKALDPYGRPVPVEGVLYENGQKIQSFTSIHNGMGKFGFVPRADRKYTVQLTQPRIDSIFALPRVLSKGVKLQVGKRDREYIHFSITRSATATTKKVYIRAQNRGLVYWMATASLEKERVTFKLPLEDFPQGIAEVTIFNEDFQPLAERLVYTNLDQKLSVSLVDVSKSTFKQKEKVTLKFKVKDEFNTPAIANFSLSVCDHLYANKNNSYSMLPHYYLFSELKGHIYDADYYFNPKNKDRAKHLDLLLLTQGWRNYVWHEEQLVTNHNPVTFNEHVTGKVFTRLKNGRLLRAPNASIKVAYPTVIHGAFIDSITGKFELPVFAYKMAQGSDFMIFPFEEDGTIIEVNDPFVSIEKIEKHKSEVFPRSDVPIQTKKQSSYDSKFSFTETNYLDEVNLKGFRRRARMYGTKGLFSASSTDYICFQYSILNCVNHPFGPRPVNGETYKLNDGTLVVYYFKGNDTGIEQNDRFVKIRGMYPEKKFYSPNYDTKDDPMFPDNRKTLVWAPNLVSDRNGEIEVSFYTSDIQSTFLGKLEGTDGYGLLGGTIFQFDVN